MSSRPLQDRTSLKRFAWLSIAAALTTIGLKTLAYLLTGSVGLLSDALESLVNLVGAMMALAMLTIAARPEDDEHAYGHTKAEYFSSGVEGALILIAALGIGVTAAQRLLVPKPLEQIGIGLGVSLGASLINLAVALAIRKAGREHHSITLEANAPSDDGCLDIRGVLPGCRGSGSDGMATPGSHRGNCGRTKHCPVRVRHYQGIRGRLDGYVAAQGRP